MLTKFSLAIFVAGILTIQTPVFEDCIIDANSARELARIYHLHNENKDIEWSSSKYKIAKDILADCYRSIRANSCEGKRRVIIIHPQLKFCTEYELTVIEDHLVENAFEVEFNPNNNREIRIFW